MKFKILLFITIITTTAAAQRWTPPKNVPPPKPERGIELIAKRTANSKTWINLDKNIVTTEVNSGFLHYRDDAGRWHDIDCNIRLAEDSSRYEVRKGIYHADFGFDLRTGAFPVTFRLRDSTFYRTKIVAFAYGDSLTGRTVTLSTPMPVRGQVSGNKIRYPNAFMGVDLEYEYQDGKLKLNAYISQAARDSLPDPQKMGINRNRAFLVLLTQYEISDSLEAFARNQKVSSKSPNNKVRMNFKGKDRLEFRNPTGKQKFLMPLDVAFSPDSSDTYPILRHFFSSGESNFVFEGVSYNWLMAQPKGTIVLDPTVALSDNTEDTYIANGSATNYGSDEKLHVGRQMTNQDWKRSLLKFDVTGIPQDATILSADLQLYFFNRVGPTSVAQQIHCHQMLKDWKESEANWTQAKNGSNWATPGVGFGTDAKSTPEDTQTWDDEYGTWKTYDLLALATAWVNGSQANYGVLLVTDNENLTNLDEKLFYSSDHANANERPKLEITYSIGPLAEYEYDALNRVTKVTYGNGTTETNTYDKYRGWLTRRDYKDAGGNNLFYFASDRVDANGNNIDYDAVGNLKYVAYAHLSEGRGRCLMAMIICTG